MLCGASGLFVRLCCCQSATSYVGVSTLSAARGQEEAGMPRSEPDTEGGVVEMCDLSGGEVSEAHRA